MKDILIKISGHQKYENDEDQQLEYITEAKMYERNGVIYLIYQESEEIGFIDGKTTVRVDDKAVRVTRRIDNNVAADMEFVQGKRVTTHYLTPAGQMALEVFANKIENTLDMDGQGHLHIDSYISLRGLATSRNTLDIEII